MELSIIIPKYCYWIITSIYLYVKLGVFFTIHTALYLSTWNYQSLAYQSHCFARSSYNVSHSALVFTVLNNLASSQNFFPHCSSPFAGTFMKRLKIFQCRALQNSNGLSLLKELTISSYTFVSYLFSTYLPIRGPSFLH